MLPWISCNMIIHILLWTLTLIVHCSGYQYSAAIITMMLSCINWYSYHGWWYWCDKQSTCLCIRQNTYLTKSYLLDDDEVETFMLGRTRWKLILLVLMIWIKYKCVQPDWVGWRRFTLQSNDRTQVLAPRLGCTGHWTPGGQHWDISSALINYAKKVQKVLY